MNQNCNIQLDGATAQLLLDGIFLLTPNGHIESLTIKQSTDFQELFRQLYKTIKPQLRQINMPQPNGQLLKSDAKIIFNQ